jgi:hypothetical protein
MGCEVKRLEKGWNNALNGIGFTWMVQGKEITLIDGIDRLKQYKDTHGRVEFPDSLKGGGELTQKLKEWAKRTK